jgi:Ca-activated chloride channel family protein
MLAPAPLLTLAALLGAIVAGTGSEEPEHLSVRILSPAEGSFISGPTALEAEVSSVPADPVARVEFYVDDVRVASVPRPPYRTSWDAGAEFNPHRVRAVAITASGRRAAAEVFTRRLVPDERTRVEVVTLYASVREKGRGYITDLRAADFVVEEDGKPQAITHFSRDLRPVSWAILLDVSASMEGRRIDTARRAAMLFVEALAPADKAMVLTFSDVIDSSPFATGDRQALLAKIETAQASGGTALYDAIVEGSERLGRMEGKKAILLLSDGRDQGLDGYGPGSSHTFEEALERVQRAEVAVYAVGLGEDLDQQLDFRRRHSLKEILETLAEGSGGRAHLVRNEGGLREVFKRVSDEVRLQYSIGYSPANKKRDGAWRTITVRAKRPELKVTARSGYFAPGGAPPSTHR